MGVSEVKCNMPAISKIPKFTSEQEEAEFWDTHDTTDYLDETEEIDITFIDARPRNQVILWFDRETLARLEVVAEKRGVSYKTMVRAWVMEKLAQED